MENDSNYSWDQYYEKIIYTVMPWIGFAILAFVILVLIIIIKCVTCKCCYKKKIKASGDLIQKIFILIASIVTVVALICCIFIIYFSDAAYQSYQQLQCASGRIPYELLNGARRYP